MKKKNQIPQDLIPPEGLPEGVTLEDLLAEEEEPLFERVMRIVRRVVLVVATIMLVIGTALMIFAGFFGQSRFLKKLPAFINYLITYGVNQTPAPMTFDTDLMNPNQKKNPDLPKFKEDAAGMLYYRDGLLDDDFLELLYIAGGGANYRKLCTAAELGILSDASFESVYGMSIATAAARYVSGTVDMSAPQFADGLTPRQRSDMLDAAPAETAAPAQTAAAPSEAPAPQAQPEETEEPEETGELPADATEAARIETTAQVPAVPEE